MKYISLTIVAFLAFLFSYGCDSVTDSKPVSTNPPVLYLPANNDTNVSLTPVFKWTGNADKLEIATTPAFGSAIIHSAAVTDTLYILPSGILTSNKFYYWRAGVTVGGTVYWSEDQFTFQTQ